MTRDELDAVMAELFPASASIASLEYVSCSERAPGVVGVTLRFVLWSVSTNADGVEQRSISDVKEQDIYLGAIAHIDVARFRAFVSAWAALLERVFASSDAKSLAWMMPHELSPFGALTLQRAHTHEDFERALSAHGRLGRYLRDRTERLVVDDVDALLRAVFPADGGRASFEYIECEKAGAFLRVTLRFIIYEMNAKREGERIVRDIKEQQCVFAPLSTEPARFEAYARAWVAVVTRAFACPPTLARNGYDVLDTLMPHDLVRSEVLALQTVTTQEQFERALMQRSRLGRLFPASEHVDGGAPAEEPLRDESL